MSVYTSLHPPSDCESCTAQCGEQYSRHSPSPDNINSYLNINSNKSLNLTESSTICNPCYNTLLIDDLHHLEIEDLSGINLVMTALLDASDVDLDSPDELEDDVNTLIQSILGTMKVMTIYITI